VPEVVTTPELAKGEEAVGVVEVAGEEGWLGFLPDSASLAERQVRDSRSAVTTTHTRRAGEKRKIQRRYMNNYSWLPIWSPACPIPSPKAAAPALPRWTRAGSSRACQARNHSCPGSSHAPCLCPCRWCLWGMRRGLIEGCGFAEVAYRDGRWNERWRHASRGQRGQCLRSPA
jgi:hypothetical protein